MRNPDGGAAERRPHFMYKVPFPAFFFFFGGKGVKKEGGYGPEPDNLEDAVA